MKQVLIKSLAIMLTFLLASCASTGLDTADALKEYKGMSAATLFNKAETGLAKGNYGDASKTFEALETLYPFGEYNHQAHMDIIYAYYMNGDSTSAVASADRFIQLYPRDPHLDYVYYMKGLANYNQDRGFITHFIHLDMASRDTTALKQSYQDFYTLITIFPRSRYAANARQHMIYLRNVLSTHELEVAQYYMTRRAYVAASNRASAVIQHYPQTSSVVDALGVIVRANAALHLDKPRQDAVRVLELNYPKSEVLQQLKREGLA